MNITSFLIVLIWLACGYLVVRFVLRTGGTTKRGHVAHWFGGAFTMIGLAMGMVWIYAQLDSTFDAHVNAYLLTHHLRPGATRQLIEWHADGSTVTVYRSGSFNPAARFETGRLVIDERQTVRTSIWWMLWDTRTATAE